MKFTTILGQIVLLVIVGFLAREGWRLYSEQHRIDRVARDGVRMTVKIDDVTTEKKTWRDYLSNSKYVHFRYEGKAYVLRYSQDSVFLQPGISIPAYYSASAGEFVQSIKGLHSEELIRTSPLVKFTVVRLFSPT